MTLDDDSAIVTRPPSPPESRLLVGRAAQWRTPSLPNGAGIGLRHEQHIRNALLEVADHRRLGPGIATGPVASGGRWRHSKVSRRSSARSGVMIRKFMRWVAAALCCLPAVSLAASDDPKELERVLAKLRSEPMIFVVATGEPNACGRGCSEWIAGQGRFDEGAAQRFREFLAVLPKRDLPIFFNSDGGLLREAVQIGLISYRSAGTRPGPGFHLP